MPITIKFDDNGVIQDISVEDKDGVIRKIDEAPAHGHPVVDGIREEINLKERNLGTLTKLKHHDGDGNWCHCVYTNALGQRIVYHC